MISLPLSPSIKDKHGFRQHAIIKYAFNYAGEGFLYRHLVICYLRFAVTCTEVAVGLPLGDLEILMELPSPSVLFVNMSSVHQHVARRTEGQGALHSMLPLPWFQDSVAHSMARWVFQKSLVRPGCAQSLEVSLSGK